MITTHPENNYEAEETVLAQNLNGLDEDANENDLIKLLARIVREQNKEINNILISQNDRAKQQAEEQRRLVDMVEKLEAKLSFFIDSHGFSCACDDATTTARSDLDLILLLRSKVDALEHTVSHIEGLTTHVHKLETQVTSFEDRLRQTVQPVNESNPKGLNAEDLQSLTEALATRQLSMQFRIDEHAETLNRLLSARDGSSSQVGQEPNPTLPLSHRRSVTHHERESVSSQSTYNSPHRHARTPSSLGTLSNASPRRSQTATASDSGHPAQNSHQQTTELIQKAAQHDSSLSSNRKEILNLKRRLAHAERLIGARYQIGAFSIHGLSFYQDAAALRYMSDPTARDAFRMFYGSRIAAVDYAEIAPTAILTCFDIISRVRCRHDMWTDDKLEVKQRIRCTAEAIVDYWMQSLPLRDGGEHIHVSARELQSRFNQLRLLCMQHDVEFDFIWPTV